MTISTSPTSRNTMHANATDILHALLAEMASEGLRLAGNAPGWWWTSLDGTRHWVTKR